MFLPLLDFPFNIIHEKFDLDGLLDDFNELIWLNDSERLTQLDNLAGLKQIDSARRLGRN